jgi:hypothetical protein
MVNADALCARSLDVAENQYVVLARRWVSTTVWCLTNRPSNEPLLSRARLVANLTLDVEGSLVRQLTLAVPSGSVCTESPLSLGADTSARGVVNLAGGSPARGQVETRPDESREISR